MINSQFYFMIDTFNKINQEIIAAGKVLIITHQGPDGDALGSALSLLMYLKALNKQAMILATGELAEYYLFLPHSGEVVSDPKIIKDNWDLIIFVDACNISYTGVEDKYLIGKRVVNIDHHQTNNYYGDIQAINSLASSTCEIVYQFFIANNILIDRRIATCLLTGILTDTGGFTNSATTLASMTIASELIKKGAKIHQTFNYIVKNKSINGLKLWGVVLSRLKVNEKYNLAYTYIKEDDYRQFNVSEEETDGLINFLNATAGVLAVMLVKINSTGTRISMRTTRNDVDVSHLASLFGGGGHKKAAGFTIPWVVQEQGGELFVLDEKIGYDNIR